jgi:hypothetical protein
MPPAAESYRTRLAIRAHTGRERARAVAKEKRPASVGARLRRVQEHLVKPAGIVATATKPCFTRCDEREDVTNEPDCGERARAAAKEKRRQADRR